MTELVLVEAVRTPAGRRNGWLRDIHPVRLGSYALCEVLARANLDPAMVDHVIMGCVTQAGEQTYNLARNVVLDAELPISVPATTVDFQCGSSQQALHLAAAMVAAGQAEVVVAGGVESMTRTPMGSSLMEKSPFTDRIMANHNVVTQGIAADEIAAQWGISREQVDDIGYMSHQRAIAATEAGHFLREMLPIEGRELNGSPFMVERDQGIRFDADRDRMRILDPAFTRDGVTTAGNSSQISDGAAALLVTSSDKARELGLRPRARIVATASVGSDPHLMLTGPVPATQKVLQRAGLRLDQIDLFEVNEAFASVVAYWQQETAVDLARVNVHGGAIALGHPLGASGARLMTTLLNALEIHDRRYGLQTMCCGGGMATATVVERLI